MVLKWGILGSGRIAKDFACSMMAVDGSECVAVASRKPSESLTAFAASFGCRPHTSYEAMAADAEVEAVYVATIHPTHYALAKMSLEAGKHCMVEKPFAMNSREAAELAALAQSKGLFLMEAMWTACLPATIEALRMVEAGEIGELQSANASVGGVWYTPEELADEEGRAAAKDLGSGVLLDVGCYAIAVPYMFYKQMGISDESIALRSSVGSLCAAGADISGTHTLSYGANPERTAVAHCSWRYMLPNEVLLYGTKGILTLNSVWGATQISVSGPAMHPGEPERNNEVKQVGYEPPAAGTEGKWSGDTAWRSGMAHEIREAEECIAAGRTESDKWPLSATLKVMELMDDARRLMEVQYPSDVVSVTLDHAVSL